MIELNHDSLVFHFPQLGKQAFCGLDFQRTLRIPDTGRTYGLPPGFGHFPLHHLDDLSDMPAAWKARGGVAMPIWQAEAMWISLYRGCDSPPFAVKIAAGKINAVTGQPWREGLSRKPQDYVVVPDQPWLDGFCVAKGEVRQFVAMRLGGGFTAEEQITGAAEHGGLQISVTPLTAEAYARWAEAERARREAEQAREYVIARSIAMDSPMGLAAGGRMRQHIYPDHRPLADWDTAATRRVFVTLLDAVTWRQAAGELPPFRPPSAGDYAAAGLPWFDWYGEDAEALGGAPVLAGLKSVAELEGLDAPDEDFSDEPRIALGPKAPRQVREPGVL